jgi:hypothetical protein
LCARTVLRPRALLKQMLAFVAFIAKEMEASERLSKMFNVTQLVRMQ